MAYDEWRGLLIDRCSGPVNGLLASKGKAALKGVEPVSSASCSVGGLCR
jgi:hypothetical protein